MADLLFKLSGKRIWVAGHRGMVGAALLRRLSREDCVLLTVDRAELDLCDQKAVAAWMAKTRPDAIFLAAAKVGGIFANDTQPVDFIHDNLLIATNIIEAAHRNHVEKLLFLGSSCIYPRLAPQPIHEQALLGGPLEPTNEFYAIAKIAGIKLCQAYRRQFGRDFITAMPTNLYGPGDNYDLESSHVLPALLRKAHEARARRDRQLVIWGSGRARREFLHVDDCADALVHVMQHYSDEVPINIGSGTDVTIAELAELIMRVVGLEGRVVTDPAKPDGMPRKLLDSGRLTELGWQPSIPLEAGIRMTYASAPFNTVPA
jgi:GDP-L-fucose synthase